MSCTIQRHRDVSEPTDVLAWTSCLDAVNRFVRQSLRKQPFSLGEITTNAVLGWYRQRIKKSRNLHIDPELFLFHPFFLVSLFSFISLLLGSHEGTCAYSAKTTLVPDTCYYTVWQTNPESTIHGMERALLGLQGLKEIHQCSTQCTSRTIRHSDYNRRRSIQASPVAKGRLLFQAGT